MYSFSLISREIQHLQRTYSLSYGAVINISYSLKCFHISISQLDLQRTCFEPKSPSLNSWGGSLFRARFASIFTHFNISQQFPDLTLRKNDFCSPRPKRATCPQICVGECTLQLACIMLSHDAHVLNQCAQIIFWWQCARFHVRIMHAPNPGHITRG